MRMSCTPVGTKTRGWWGIILGLGHGPRTVHARRPDHRPPPHTDRSPQRRRARYPGAAHVPGRPDTPHHAGPRSYVRRRDQQRDTLLSGCARVRWLTPALSWPPSCYALRLRHHGVCSVYPAGTPAAALISSRPHPGCVCVRELWAGAGGDRARYTVRGLMRLVNPGGGQLAKATPPYTLPILFGRSIRSYRANAWLLAGVPGTTVLSFSLLSSSSSLSSFITCLAWPWPPPSPVFLSPCSFRLLHACMVSRTSLWAGVRLDEWFCLGLHRNNLQCATSSFYF